MHLIINDEQDKHLLSKKLLQTVEKSIAKLASAENIPSDKEVGLIFVDNEVIQELNRNYRGIDSPTDVLSFALNEGEHEPCACAEATIGDIYVSVERAFEQAEEYGHSTDREICFLALHGLLHLVGYDHQTPEDETVMNQKIEQVLLEFDLTR